MDSEKPYKASKKKIENALKQGKVPRVGHLSFGIVFLVVILYFLSLKQLIWRYVEQSLHALWGSSLDFGVQKLLPLGIVLALVSIAPLFLAGIVSSFVTSKLTGSRLYMGHLVPKAERLNPGSFTAKVTQGIKKMPLEIIKIIIFVFVVYWILKWFWPWHLVFPSRSGTTYYYKGFVSAITCCGLLVLSLAIFDGWIKIKRHYKELGMSLEEVRREHREDEGDPYMKSLRSAMHQELISEALVRQVRKAKVIIVERQEG